MRVLVTYDISNNKRRRGVVKLLLGYFERVQKSVFEGFVSKQKYRECCEKSKKLIDPTADSIRFYPLCSSCSDAMNFYGVNTNIEKRDLIII